MISDILLRKGRHCRVTADAELVDLHADDSVVRQGGQMNRRITRWLYKKAAQALGEEELESLKSDLITPVKIAMKDALEDMLEDRDEEEQ